MTLSINRTPILDVTTLHSLVLPHGLQIRFLSQAEPLQRGSPGNARYGVNGSGPEVDPGGRWQAWPVLPTTPRVIAGVVGALPPI